MVQLAGHSCSGGLGVAVLRREQESALFVQLEEDENLPVLHDDRLEEPRRCSEEVAAVLHLRADDPRDGVGLELVALAVPLEEGDLVVDGIDDHPAVPDLHMVLGRRLGGLRRGRGGWLAGGVRVGGVAEEAEQDGQETEKGHERTPDVSTVYSL